MLKNKEFLAGEKNKEFRKSKERKDRGLETPNQKNKASRKLRGDYEIVMMAVSKTWRVLCFASEDRRSPDYSSNLCPPKTFAI